MDPGSSSTQEEEVWSILDVDKMLSLNSNLTVLWLISKMLGAREIIVLGDPGWFVKSVSFLNNNMVHCLRIRKEHLFTLQRGHSAKKILELRMMAYPK